MPEGTYLMEIEPLHHCHYCKAKAPCLVSDIRPRHSGYSCSNCGAVRWSGVVTPIGARVIGLACAKGSFLCRKCADDNTRPGFSTPDLPYVHGPVAHMYADDSSYKNDINCDECGELICP